MTFMQKIINLNFIKDIIDGQISGLIQDAGSGRITNVEKNHKVEALIQLRETIKEFIQNQNQLTDN
jgi:hypothetical protein